MPITFNESCVKEEFLPKYLVYIFHNLMFVCLFLSFHQRQGDNAPNTKKCYDEWKRAALMRRIRKHNPRKVTRVKPLLLFKRRWRSVNFYIFYILSYSSLFFYPFLESYFPNINQVKNMSPGGEHKIRSSQGCRKSRVDDGNGKRKVAVTMEWVHWWTLPW